MMDETISFSTPQRVRSSGGLLTPLMDFSPHLSPIMNSGSKPPPKRSPMNAGTPHARVMLQSPLPGIAEEDTESSHSKSMSIVRKPLPQENVNADDLSVESISLMDFTPTRKRLEDTLNSISLLPEDIGGTDFPLVRSDPSSPQEEKNEINPKEKQTPPKHETMSSRSISNLQLNLQSIFEHESLNQEKSKLATIVSDAESESLKAKYETLSRAREENQRLISYIQERYGSKQSKATDKLQIETTNTQSRALGTQSPSTLYSPSSPFPSVNTDIASALPLGTFFTLVADASNRPVLVPVLPAGNNNSNGNNTANANDSHNYNHHPPHTGSFLPTRSISPATNYHNNNHHSNKNNQYSSSALSSSSSSAAASEHVRFRDEAEVIPIPHTTTTNVHSPYDPNNYHHNHHNDSDSNDNDNNNSNSNSSSNSNSNNNTNDNTTLLMNSISYLLDQSHPQPSSNHNHNHNHNHSHNNHSPSVRQRFRKYDTNTNTNTNANNPYPYDRYDPHQLAFEEYLRHRQRPPNYPPPYSPYPYHYPHPQHHPRHHHVHPYDHDYNCDYGYEYDHYDYDYDPAQYYDSLPTASQPPDLQSLCDRFYSNTNYSSTSTPLPTTRSRSRSRSPLPPRTRALSPSPFPLPFALSLDMAYTANRSRKRSLSPWQLRSTSPHLLSHSLSHLPSRSSLSPYRKVYGTSRAPFANNTATIISSDRIHHPQHTLPTMSFVSDTPRRALFPAEDTAVNLNPNPGDGHNTHMGEHSDPLHGSDFWRTKLTQRSLTSVLSSPLLKRI